MTTLETKAPRQFNLSLKKGREAALKVFEQEKQDHEKNVADGCWSDDHLSPLGGINTYITKGTPELLHRDMAILETADGFYFVKEGVVYPSSYTSRSLQDLAKNAEDLVSLIKNSLLNQPEGFVLPKPVGTNQNDASLTILQNGDEGNNSFVDTLSEYEFPTVSFRCLSRFYDDTDEDKGLKEMIDSLKSGDLQVLGFVPDDRKVLTRDELAAFKAYDQAKEKRTKPLLTPPAPPERGFVRVGDDWHRSATVLMYDKTKRMTLLLGMDENSYFGCELPGSPKKISDAYAALMPKDLRDRNDLSRQGEWYFVPVSEEEVPLIAEAALHSESFALPVEHEDSNLHYVSCTDGRVDKKGVIYALDPSMEHDDHATVTREGWYTFRRNTAKRSYSEAGVD